MSSSDLKLVFLICLHQDDNHTSHAVAAVDNFIFDCNATNALLLTKEGLDCVVGKRLHFNMFLVVTNLLCKTK